MSKWPLLTTQTRKCRKIDEKINKYQDLAKVMKIFWNMKTKLIPVAISVLGTTSERRAKIPIVRDSLGICYLCYPKKPLTRHHDNIRTGQSVVHVSSHH